jgi:hypothetical protein
MERGPEQIAFLRKNNVASDILVVRGWGQGRQHGAGLAERGCAWNCA